MSTLCLTARGSATVEARPNSQTIVVKIGGALISMDATDAHQLGEGLLAAAAPASVEGISGQVTATADHVLDAVVIAVGGRRLLELSVDAWSSLSMQGSSAALELKGPALRVGMRSAQLLRGNADLVEEAA
jgi:hypothetical protein